MIVVNECDMIAGVCENGKCMDTDDTYMCMCNPGFKLSMDGKKCTGMFYNIHVTYVTSMLTFRSSRQELFT